MPSVEVQKFALSKPLLLATATIWSNIFYISSGNGPVEAWLLDTGTSKFVRSPHQSSNVFNGKGATPCVSAANRSTLLWSCNQAAGAANVAGYAIKFAVPTIANGKVVVGTRGNNIGAPYNSTSVNGELDIYGLKP